MGGLVASLPPLTPYHHPLLIIPHPSLPSLHWPTAIFLTKCLFLHNAHSPISSFFFSRNLSQIPINQIFWDDMGRYGPSWTNAFLPPTHCILNSTHCIQAPTHFSTIIHFNSAFTPLHPLQYYFPKHIATQLKTYT